MSTAVELYVIAGMVGASLVSATIYYSVCSRIQRRREKKKLEFEIQKQQIIEERKKADLQDHYNAIKNFAFFFSDIPEKQESAGQNGSKQEKSAKENPVQGNPEGDNPEGDNSEEKNPSEQKPAEEKPTREEPGEPKPESNTSDDEQSADETVPLLAAQHHSPSSGTTNPTKSS